MKHPKNFGFTLIELMVVVSIIGILTAVGLSAYSKSQVSARDNRRKQDIRSIAGALNLYYQTNKRYPETYSSPRSNYWQQSTDSSPWLDDRGGSPIIHFDGTYLTTLPVDPSGGSTYVYQYYSWPGDFSVTCRKGQYFFLYANLENASDPDALSQKPVSPCGVSATNWAPGYAFVMTSEP